MYNLQMESIKRSLASLRGRCLCLTCKWNLPEGFDITGFCIPFGNLSYGDAFCPDMVSKSSNKEN